MVAGWPKIFFIHKHVYLLTNSTHNIRFRNFCEATNELNDQSEIKYKKICEWKKNRRFEYMPAHIFDAAIHIQIILRKANDFLLAFLFYFFRLVRVLACMCEFVFLYTFYGCRFSFWDFFSLQVLFCVQIKARKKLPTHRSCCESIMCEIVRMHPDASYLTAVMMLIFPILLPIILVKKLKTHIFNVTYMICNDDWRCIYTLNKHCTYIHTYVHGQNH